MRDCSNHLNNLLKKYNHNGQYNSWDEMVSLCDVLSKALKEKRKKLQEKNDILRGREKTNNRFDIEDIGDDLELLDAMKYLAKSQDSLLRVYENFSKAATTMDLTISSNLKKNINIVKSFN